MPKTLLRLRRTDPAAARRAETALDELLGEGGLADLTQHDLQSYLWFTLAEEDEPQLTAAALATLLRAGRAEPLRRRSPQSAQTKEILRAYEERGEPAGRQGRRPRRWTPPASCRPTCPSSSGAS